MVIKGKARGGASALAVHLQRRDTNEDVRLRDFDGVTSRDVLGALCEMDAMGSAAASRRTLYHAAINTAPHELLTDDQKRRAVESLADELGFKGQPRIVVEHLKKDREHMHVVFLRIDVERNVAIPDSHNYRKHEAVARALEREFGHEHVQGAHVDRDGKERPGRTPGHDEMQQAERSKISPEGAKKQITELWHQADSGRAFAASLAAEGWLLAKGDRRDFVVVDHAGEPHSLARRIEGAKAADIKQRLSDVDLAALPTVEEAKAQQRSAIDATHKIEEQAPPQLQPAASEPPTLLRVEATPAHRPPHLQLELDPTSAAPTALPKPAAASPVTEDKSQAPPQPVEAAQTAKPGRAKRIYDAAAAHTRNLYDKARSVFESKPALEPEAKAARVKQKPKTAEKEKPIEQLTPPQREMRSKREAARAVQQLETKTVVHTPAPEVAADRSRDRGRSRSISDFEIQQLLDRQHRQRDLSGPSR